MLLGKHTLHISPDGRLALPADLRVELSRDSLVFTQGLDHNILLFTKSAFERLYAQVRTTSITDPLARLLNRVIMGNAAESRTDAENNLEVPEALRDFAGFQGEVVLVGQGEYVELWSTADWKKQAETMQDHSQNANRFEKFNVSLA